MAEEKGGGKGSFLDQIKAFFSRLTSSQKLFLSSVAVLSFAAIWLLTSLANTLTYSVLFSNLDARDSAVILEKLKEKKIPYKLSGGGAVISVPDSQVGELRIQLAGEGLPQGGAIGFEIFDKNSLSTTDFVQNINYVRAIEGELARSLGQLREVQSAKVHITLPKKSVFVAEKEEAKASIVIRPKAGMMLSNSLIPAIIHLTAQSVEGLRPDNIAVIDVNGQLLSKPRDSMNLLESQNDHQFVYQKSLEQRYTQKIIELLEPIVGNGKVRANVQLVLDFSQVSVTEQSVDPDRTVKISEKTESSKNNQGAAGGIPGVGSNVAAAAVVNTATGGDGASSKSESTITNYEISKTTTQTIKPLGIIQRVSAAVVLDNMTQVQMTDGQMVKQSVPQTPEMLDSIRKIVSAAVGYDQQRGDLVEVANLPFDTSGQMEGEYLYEKQKSGDLLDLLVRYGSILIGGLLVFLLILRPVLRKVSRVVSSALSPARPDLSLPHIDGEKLDALQSAKDEFEIEQELRERYKVPKNTKKMGILKDKVKEFANEHIDETASLIKTYLMED
jgi:flagellar M-ring protein FliF